MLNHRPGRSGFSLIGLIVFLAVVAILAGALVPAYFEQLARAREDATLAEMERLEAGLADFHRDVGRLPDGAEGLAALVVDPGAAGWRGPYVTTLGEVPETAVTTDAWGQAYAYDPAPAFDTAESAAALIASGGRDRALASGSVGGTWSPAAAGDDLLRPVEVDAGERAFDEESAAEIEVIAAAAQEYFRDRGAYPTALNQLEDTYLDGGIDAGRLEDGWRRGYLLTADNAAVPPTLQVRSRGPDGVDDGGTGDDLVRDIASDAPGRRATLHEIGIAQAALDAAPGLTLTGDWSTERTNLGLDPFLDDDAWGHAYEVRVSTRTVLSGGPDADYDTPADNIPPGVVPDDAPPPTGDPIEFVEGTEHAHNNQCEDVGFDITNNSGGAVVITSMTVSWTGPSAWFTGVEIGGVTCHDDFSNGIGSGDTVALSPAYTLAAGTTATVDLLGFRSKQGSGGKKVDMSGAVFTVVFSDGTVVSFTVPPC